MHDETLQGALLVLWKLQLVLSTLSKGVSAETPLDPPLPCGTGPSWTWLYVVVKRVQWVQVGLSWVTWTVDPFIWPWMEMDTWERLAAGIVKSLNWWAILDWKTTVLSFTYCCSNSLGLQSSPSSLECLNFSHSTLVSLSLICWAGCAQSMQRSLSLNVLRMLRGTYNSVRFLPAVHFFVVSA